MELFGLACAYVVWVDKLENEVRVVGLWGVEVVTSCRRSPTVRPIRWFYESKGSLPAREFVLRREVLVFQTSHLRGPRRHFACA